MEAVYGEDKKKYRLFTTESLSDIGRKAEDLSYRRLCPAVG